jgi:hypothetical protein
MAFTFQLLRALAGWSAKAYDAPTITDRATNAAALVTLDDNGNIIVAFRGSKNPRDFVQDAKFGMTRLITLSGGEEVHVHLGFKEDFEAIAVAVITNVKTLLAMNSQAKVWLTGHSLGGALAILCAMEFRRQGIPVSQVITFGQPRVGNAAFAAMYDAMPGLKQLTIRVINQNDLIPRTPGWLMGYRHCGYEVLLFTPLFGGAVDFEVNPTLLQKLIADTIGLYGAYRYREEVLIREHFMNAYETALKNL